MLVFDGRIGEERGIAALALPSPACADSGTAELSARGRDCRTWLISFEGGQCDDVSHRLACRERGLAGR